MKQSFRSLFSLLLFLILVLASTVLAHQVRVFAYSSGDAVIVEAFIGNNQPLHNGEVIVTSSTDEKSLYQGQTDNQGRFQFPRPQLPLNNSLTITVDAGQGHKGYWTLHPEDFSQGSLPPTQGQHAPVPQASPNSIEPSLSPTEQQQLAELVAQAVAREVEPLKVMLAKEMSKGPSLQEIIGGIGWLIGIGGLLIALKKKQ